MIYKNEISGILHCHTEYSLLDGCCSTATLVNYAVKKHCPAIAITDHGNVDGAMDFYYACMRKGVKPILGIEAYVEEQDEGRKHLVILARDQNGWDALRDAVKDSQKRIFTDKSGSYPRMDKKILKRNFGPGALGYGHVFILSGCIKGPIAGMLNYNQGIKKKIKRLQNEQKQYMNRDSLLVLKESYETIEQKVISLGMQCDLYKDLKKEYEMYRKKLSSAKKALVHAGDRYRKAQTNVKKMEEIEQQIHKLRDSYSSDQYALAREEALFYKSLGGFFIELQYHGMNEEQCIMVQLIKIAHELDIPLVATNDVHYARKEDVECRRFLKALKHGKPAEPLPADMELYMKTDQELSDMLLQVYPSDIVKESIDNIGVVVSGCGSYALSGQETETGRNFQINSDDLLDLLYICNKCLDKLKCNGYNLQWDTIPFDRQAVTSYLKAGKREVLALFEGRNLDALPGKNYSLTESALYRCWYILSHEPCAFLCSVLEQLPVLLPQVQKYCLAKGIKIKRPDVNRSMLSPIPDGKGILLGLGFIPGMDEVWERFYQERKNGEFKDFQDLEKRTGLDVICSLMKKLCTPGHQGAEESTLDREYFGTYLSLGCLAGYPSSTISMEGEQDYLSLYGIIFDMEEIDAKNGSVMCRLLLQTRDRRYHIVVFPWLYMRLRGRIHAGMPAKVKCKWVDQETDNNKDALSAMGIKILRPIYYYLGGQKSMIKADGDSPWEQDVLIQNPDGSLSYWEDSGYIAEAKIVPEL